ncbi:hypothetical protein KJ865_14215, partial [Myxococcota bacterium]|nr:hypothetical protein [Myxococcota bacterium]
MKIRLFTIICTVLLTAGPVACKKSEKEEKTTADNTTATTTPEMAPEKTNPEAPEPAKVEKPAV